MVDEILHARALRVRVPDVAETTYTAFNKTWHETTLRLIWRQTLEAALARIAAIPAPHLTADHATRPFAPDPSASTPGALPTAARTCFTAS